MYDVAVIVGSLRKASINKKLAKAVMQLELPSLSFYQVALQDLPIYNQDLEEDRPSAVRYFTAECPRADAVLMVTPEYNRSLPAVLKNAIDWGSKPMAENVWKDKPSAMLGASPGAVGTAVGQQHLRQVLGILGAYVLGGEAYITFKPELIDDQGLIAVDATRKFLQDYMLRFTALTEKLVVK